jgi:hypothetical protein
MKSRGKWSNPDAKRAAMEDMAKDPDFKKKKPIIVDKYTYDIYEPTIQFSTIKPSTLFKKYFWMNVTILTNKL